MKCLFIGYLRAASGWGTAARDYALALDASGVDVAIRCIHIGDSSFELTGRLAELENKDSSNSTHLIQHLLPHHMEYNGRLQKNIGLFVCETGFKESSWADSLNLMDELIVPCWSNLRAAVESGVTVPIHLVPHATDISRFERSYDVLEQLKPYRDQGSFIFYAIGEWVRRKNFGALLRAFHTEFDPDENVELVIKSSWPGLPAAEAQSRIESACDDIKTNLKLHGGNREGYKKEIIITDRLTQEGMMKLHASCDCFVLPSHAEAWMQPGFDAMAMGKTPILPNCSPYTEYMYLNLEPGGWLVNTHDSQVFGVTDSFADLFTGRETWKDVNQSHLRACLRHAFEDAEARAARSEVGRESAYGFTYHKVGEIFKKVLFHGEKT